MFLTISTSSVSLTDVGVSVTDVGASLTDVGAPSTGAAFSATDLGYLLHKHPGKPQSFDLAFGRAHVFYIEATAERCTAALLLDVDPIGLVRGKGTERTLDQYVNDRPYVASSMLAVAIAQLRPRLVRTLRLEVAELVQAESRQAPVRG